MTRVLLHYFSQVLILGEVRISKVKFKLLAQIAEKGLKHLLFVLIGLGTVLFYSLGLKVGFNFLKLLMNFSFFVIFENLWSRGEWSGWSTTASSPAVKAVWGELATMALFLTMVERGWSSANRAT